MSTAARSLFTEAIEDHLSLKKQNAGIEPAMPLARYDVGDPLDRYPGGPSRVPDGMTVAVDEAASMDAGGAAPAGDAVAPEPMATDATQLLVGPSPEQAMEAATALEPAFADRPFEPLTGMAPMLSLVEDIEDEDDAAGMSAQMPMLPHADVLHFPGADAAAHASMPGDVMDDFTAAAPAGAGMDAPGPIPGQLPLEGHDAPTGEHPAVLVVDSDEPLATSDEDAEPPTASRSSSRRSKPRFFGLGRKKEQQSNQAEGWFTDGPRDFNWD